MDEQSAVRLVCSDESSEAKLLDVFQCLDLDGELREAALNHKRVTDDAIRFMLVSGNHGLRARILASTDRVAILTEWSNALDPDDRALVAFNPSTPVSSVRALARDEEPRVRANAVFNPRLPETVVAEMAALDGDEDVRDAAETSLTTAIGWSLRRGRRWVADTSDE